MAGKSKSSGFDSYMRGAGAVQGRKKGPNKTPSQRNKIESGTMPENMPPAGMKKDMKTMPTIEKMRKMMD